MATTVAICVKCKLKFTSCLLLNEHYITAHTSHTPRNNSDKYRQVIDKILENDTHNQSNINTVLNRQLSMDLTDEQRARIREQNRDYMRRHRACLTEEKRMEIRKHNREHQRLKYMKLTQQEIEKVREHKRELRRKRLWNDEEILVQKVGKDRAIQLRGYIDKEVKKCVDSGVEYLSGNQYEDKHSVDNHIDFDSITSNVIENIKLNEITNALKQENEDCVNDVCFNANNEQIEIILPTITPKQFISCEKKKSLFNLESDLMKRIILRKLLIQLNLKFLKHMCERMGLKGIESLNTHQRVRYNAFYACFWPHCNTTFNFDKTLTDHLKLEHNKGNNMSQQNHDNNNGNESDMNKVENTSNCNYNSDYFLKHCDQKIYVCCKCDEKFRNVHHLYDHIITHIDKPFMCDFCDNRFDSINELLSHRDYTHFKRKFLCDVCDYKSMTELTLFNHKIRKHGKEKKNICNESECSGKTFTSRYELIRHQMIAHKDKRYECVWPECGANFKDSRNLNNHLKSHLGVKENNRYYCDYAECNGKIFKTKFELNIHERSIHNDMRPFACDWPQCCARFKTRNALRLHSKGVHSKMEPNQEQRLKYKCPLCDYTGHKVLLWLHKKRVHEKEKRFVCDIPECNGKRFHTKQELNDHKNSVHSDKRPFVCDWPQCNSAFKLKNNLKSHIKKSHTRN